MSIMREILSITVILAHAGISSSVREAGKWLLISIALLCALALPTHAAAQTEPAQVCLYSKANYGGDEYCATSNIGFVPLRFTTASVKLPRGYKVTLYRFPFFIGDSSEQLRSNANFTELGGNVRSFRFSERESDTPLAIALAPIIELLSAEELDPDDYDGDGYPNDMEDDYGTNPRDPTSTPPDIDNDKIPDDVDDDRDGDGVDNDIEEDSDTDPNDPLDYPDLVPPVIDVNNPLTVYTSAAEIILTGQVYDPVQPYYGLKEFYITSSAYPDIVFPGGVSTGGDDCDEDDDEDEDGRDDDDDEDGRDEDDDDEDGRNEDDDDDDDEDDEDDDDDHGDDDDDDNDEDQCPNGGPFEVEIPLKWGSNTLSLIATDRSNNMTTVTIQVYRSNIPTFESITPASGTVSTVDSITLSGQVRTSLPADVFTVTINGSQVVTTGTDQSDVYAFLFENVPLVLGQNTFRFSVSSELGGDQEVVVIDYQPEGAEELDPPSITGITPSDGSTLNQQSFRIGAQIESFAGPLTVWLDGVEVLSAAEGLTFYSLNQLLSFADGQSSVSAEIIATDTLGKSTSASVTYYRDADQPVLLFDQNFQPLPMMVSVDRSPVRFSGTVSDANLASLLVNDQSLSLTPTADPTSYLFEISVPVTGDQPVPVNFAAYDRSGNSTIIEFALINDAGASINALLPPDDTTFIADDAPLEVQVVARLEGQANNDTVVAYLQSGGAASAIPLTITGTLASGDIQLPNTSGEQTIVFELRNAQEQRITSDQNTVTVTRAEDVPLEAIRIEPANNAEFVEPNAPIEIYFNRSIELADLQVDVKETLHGKSYLNADPLGEDFIRAQGYVLSDVNRDLEVVDGQLNIIPGEAGAVFSANRNFGFNADLFVEVTYQGEQLLRSRFKVRELPTFINGAVVDQFGQPLQGVKVSVPELKRTATTNGDGGFAFGYQESGEQTIPGGSYRLIVNDDFDNPRFGTVNTVINIQRNRINALPRYTLQELDRSIPFYNLSSNAGNNLLGGDLIVNLTQGRAVFPNSRTSGPVHAQFLPFEHLGVSTFEFALPHWLYGLQPKGITVEGEAQLEFKIPKLRGTYDYLDAEAYQYVVLLGYSPSGQVVEPIGVGKIDNLSVTSVGKLHLQSLDYLGYAVVLPNITEELEKYANGLISLQQLKAVLQAQELLPDQ